MSDSETVQQSVPRRSSFASRLLTKELDIRKKTTQEIKISPADAAKYAAPQQTSAETKEAAPVK